MPFNSDTYHANKARRQRDEEMVEARAMRQRLTEGTGTLLDTPERLSRLVSSARLHNRISRVFRDFAEAAKGRLNR